MQQLSNYSYPALAVDIIALCIRDAGLYCLLIRREDGDVVGGDWALPGAFVHQGQPLEEAVGRAAQTKAGIGDLHLEQLAVYGDPGRDPRGHVVSIAWLAIAPEATFQSRMSGREDLQLARVHIPEGNPSAAIVKDDAGAPIRLAFDHEAILADAVRRLQERIASGPVGFAFLPKRFTLRDVQQVHEVILGRSLAKPAFRRKLLDHYPLRATGDYETGNAFRPAELYELDASNRT